MALLLRALVGLIVLLALVGVGWLGKAWYDSRLPGSFNAMDYGVVELGGGRRRTTPSIRISASTG